MMALHRRKKSSNAAELLSRRSKGIGDAGTLVRHNRKMLRGIILQENRTYMKVWSKTSESAIVYENSKLYLKNYRHCYSCVHAEPHILYKFPKRQKEENIEDTLLCQNPLEKTLACPSDHKPCLLALTASNWLIRRSLETGQELQRVYLSPFYAFSCICWNVSQETFYLKSIPEEEVPIPRQAGLEEEEDDIVMCFAIFRIFPLEFVGALDIRKRVFGNDVTGADLAQDILAVYDGNHSVKMYSLEYILQRYVIEKATLGKQSPLLGGERVGLPPFGIPLNIHITDCPPVLFKLPCAGNSVQIGGNPWHYIYSLCKSCKKYNGAYYICSLKDSTMATNGVQFMGSYSLECDEIFFHPDDSGRIIHVGPATIDVLKILQPESDLPSEVVEDFSLKANATYQVYVTSTGRIIKRRFQQVNDDSSQKIFQTVAYDEELELLAVVVTNKDEEEESGAQIQLHDNQTGQLLRTIDLIESWEKSHKNWVCFNKDTIVHIEQMSATGICCHVYKLRTRT